MSSFRLTITLELPEQPDEDAIQNARNFVESLIPHQNKPSEELVKVALTRDGDRSGGNLLLPRLEGRFGDHLQNRKATLKEVLEEKESK